MFLNISKKLIFLPSFYFHKKSVPTPSSPLKRVSLSPCPCRRRPSPPRSCASETENSSREMYCRISFLFQGNKWFLLPNFIRVSGKEVKFIAEAHLHFRETDGIYFRSSSTNKSPCTKMELFRRIWISYRKWNYGLSFGYKVLSNPWSSLAYGT